MNQTTDLAKYVVDAVEAVDFKLIRDRSDIEDESKSFHPEMAHQIFGDTEKIFGYKDLKIKMYYSAGPLNLYFGMSYSDKIKATSSEMLKADDVAKQVAEVLPEGCYYTNLDEFLMSLERNESFKPHGEKIDSFEINKDGENRKFEIYKSEITTPKFQSFCSRLQTFILWFVDAACYIDVDDPVWVIFVVYEKYTNSQGQQLYATIGYSTIYQYYAYPENIRPRISQMLVLPPYQKLGIGCKMIEAIYNFYTPNKNVLDISVEDPSEEFSRIRNYIDVKICKDLPSFAPEKLINGFSKDMIKEAREKRKINKKQCRIVYEIIRLMHTNKNNETEYKAYRLDIKKRLNLTFFKARADMEKLRKRGYDLQTAVLLPSVEEKIEQLKFEYKQIEENYMRILKKFNE